MLKGSPCSAWPETWSPMPLEAAGSAPPACQPRAFAFVILSAWPTLPQLVCGLCSSLLLVFAQVFSETSHHLIEGCNLPQISFLALIFSPQYSLLIFSCSLIVSSLKEKLHEGRIFLYMCLICSLLYPLHLEQCVVPSRINKYLLND